MRSLDATREEEEEGRTEEEEEGGARHMSQTSQVDLKQT